VDLLNTGQIDAMASDMPELLLPIVSDFEASGRESLSKLHRALTEMRYDEAKGILHQLKGAAGTMGMVEFQELCRECEDQIAAHTIPTRFGELGDLMIQSVHGAAAYLRGEQTPH
jgi:HPt (histidine-containing phosphotransfer) domain-containing protein